MITLPALRDKKRYIAFEVTSEKPVTRSGISEEISGSVRSLFGDAGACEINLGLMSCDGRYGIVRCAKKKTADARAALACVTEIGEVRVSILVLGISGTVRGAMEKFIQQPLNKEP